MKVINKVVNNKGKIITEANEILKEQYDFERTVENCILQVWLI